jgi:hypothetical protein
MDTSADARPARRRSPGTRSRRRRGCGYGWRWRSARAGPPGSCRGGCARGPASGRGRRRRATSRSATRSQRLRVTRWRSLEGDRGQASLAAAPATVFELGPGIRMAVRRAELRQGAQEGGASVACRDDTSMLIVAEGTCIAVTCGGATCSSCQIGPLTQYAPNHIVDS